MIEFLDVFGYKINIFHISCTIAFISSIDHGYFVLVFTPKFLVSVTFACITTSAPELFWLNRWSSEITSELQWVLPVTYCENCEYELLKYYTLLLFLFRSGLARHGLKWPYQKANRRRSSGTLKHAPAWKLAPEKMFNLLLQIAKIYLNYQLQRLAYKYRKQPLWSLLWKKSS